MKDTTKNKFVDLFRKHKELKASEVAKRLVLSRQRVHQILKILVQNGVLEKYGSPPTVYYQLAKSIKPPKEGAYIDVPGVINSFFLITARGEILEGYHAFEHWCIQRNLPIEKTALNYAETNKKYERYKSSLGLIDGTEKLTNTKGLDLAMDRIWYCDFYAIER